MTIEKRDRIRVEKIEEYCEDILQILQEINEVGFYENQIVHHYGAVNQKILWDIACNDIPELQAFCTDVLRDVAFDM